MDDLSKKDRDGDAQPFELLKKYRFRWRAGGREWTEIVEAENYPLACYKLGVIHFVSMTKQGRPPRDFAIDLTRMETEGETTKLTYGVCRKCGCTDADCAQCVEKTGGPCSWVDASHTLCSACV
jgi:hypothetical protein